MKFDAHELQILIGEALRVVDKRARPHERAEMLERVMRAEPLVQQFSLEGTNGTRVNSTVGRRARALGNLFQQLRAGKKALNCQSL